MRYRTAIALWLAVAATGTIAHAADPRYPDWPCTQAKVPEISLAAVWAGPPLDDVTGKWKDDAKVSALVARLAARRTPLEEAQKAITEYLNGASDKTASGKLLFAGLFETLNAQRSQVMNGLERVTRKQREAADKIRNGSFRDLVDGATDFAKRQPAAFLGLSVLAGFAVVRFLKASGGSSTQGPSASSSYTPYSDNASSSPASGSQRGET